MEKSRQRGFTLVEAIVALGIVSILASVLLQMLVTGTRVNRISLDRDRATTAARREVEVFKRDFDLYNTTLSDAVVGGANVRTKSFYINSDGTILGIEPEAAAQRRAKVDVVLRQTSQSSTSITSADALVRPQFLDVTASSMPLLITKTGAVYTLTAANSAGNVVLSQNSTSLPVFLRYTGTGSAPAIGLSFANSDLDINIYTIGFGAYNGGTGGPQVGTLDCTTNVNVIPLTETGGEKIADHAIWQISVVVTDIADSTNVLADVRDNWLVIRNP